MSSRTARVQWPWLMLAKASVFSCRRGSRVEYFWRNPAWDMGKKLLLSQNSRILLARILSKTLLRLLRREIGR